MAMLAEPRRKTKYSVNPRGQDWSKDGNKFGQKLMEKMGWSSGKGLGASESGAVDPIAVKVKNDNKGVGCTQSHADNWIAHQDDFNALLSSLNTQATDSNPGSDAEATVSSLEEKSKTAKRRVHYQKFAKGKDLSVKKAEELDCIFGRRKSNPSTPLSQSTTNTPRASDDEAAESDDVSADESGVDKTNGVVTVKNELSVSEYFAQKMAAMKAKLKSNSTALNGNDSDNSSDTKTLDAKKQPTSDEASSDLNDRSRKRKKSKKNKQSKRSESDKQDDENEEPPTKKQKKSKRKVPEKEEDLSDSVKPQNGVEHGCDVDKDLGSKKSKKKKKSKQPENEGPVDISSAEVGINSLSENKSKKKKKKNKKQK